MLDYRMIFAIMTIILLLMTYLFVPPVFHGDAASAVYLLNTVAATLSTIFALSLTLIMVAIQLSAGKYSPRIFDFFLRSPLNAPLIIIYVTAILHSTFILAQLKVTHDNTANEFFSKAISFDVILMAYGFIFLLVYIFGIVEILKPENLVTRLRAEVLNKLKRHRIKEAIIHIERLSDVAKKTTLEMDTVTAVLSAGAIAEAISLAHFKNTEEKSLFMGHILSNLNGIAVVAFNEKVHSVGEVIIDELRGIALTALQKEEYKICEDIVENLSFIASATLVGRKQLMVVQKIMSHMENIALIAVLKSAGNPQAASLTTKVFKTLNYLGKQIMDTEPLGVAFVSKYIVTDGLGTVLARLGEKRCDKVVPEIFYEYADLVVRVVRKGEAKNIITITTWFRKHLLDNGVEQGKVFLFLKTYLVVASVAIYLKRYDKASLVIKALGKYFSPEQAILKELQEEETIVRRFFDYHKPDKYLKEAYFIWGIYYETCQMQKLAPVDISKGEIYQNLQKWESLFDGLSVEDVLNDEEISDELIRDLVTKEDIFEKDS